MQAAGRRTTAAAAAATAAWLFEWRGSREINFFFLNPALNQREARGNLCASAPFLKKGGLQQKVGHPGTKQPTSPSLAPAWQFCHLGAMGLEKHGAANQGWLRVSQGKVYSQARRPKLERAQGPERCQLGQCLPRHLPDLSDPVSKTPLQLASVTLCMSSWAFISPGNPLGWK